MKNKQFSNAGRYWTFVCRKQTLSQETNPAEKIFYYCGIKTKWLKIKMTLQIAFHSNVCYAIVFPPNNYHVRGSWLILAPWNKRKHPFTRPYPKGNIIGSLRRLNLRVNIKILLQIGSHPIVWYCNRLSPDNPHVRGLQLYYWLCSMSVILILRALGTFDKILWDENSLLPHHPCAWNLQRFWIWSPSFHCRKKASEMFSRFKLF